MARKYIELEEQRENLPKALKENFKVDEATSISFLEIFDTKGDFIPSNKEYYIENIEGYDVETEIKDSNGNKIYTNCDGLNVFIERENNSKILINKVDEKGKRIRVRGNIEE